MAKQFCVYILANRPGGVIYTGVTSDLKPRVYQHRHGMTGGFTSRYNVKRLVYYEVAHTAQAAIAREKQIKAGPRRRKVALIEADNPGWKDLYDEI